MQLHLTCLLAAAGIDPAQGPPDAEQWPRLLALLEAERTHPPAVLEALGAGLCLLDGAGRITYANVTAQRLCGRDAATLAGQPLDELLTSPGGATPLLRPGGGRACPDEGLLVRAGGGPPLPVAYLLTPLAEQPGAVLLLLDQTERLRDQEALHESRERLHHIIETSPDLITVIALDGLMLVANSAFRHVLGQEPYFVVGGPMEDVFHPEDLPALTATFEEALAERDRLPAHGLEMTARARHRAGHWVPLELRAQVLTDAGGTPVAWLVLARDVTERLRAEQLTHQARDEAERASRAKNDFLSRMSHELRTPLNAILGFAQLLETDATSPAQVEGVGFILKAGRHLLDLINETLDIARIEAGRLELHPEPVRLRMLVEEVLQLVRPLAAEQRVLCHVDQPLDDGMAVLADEQRLKQVLLNLLSNAIKYNHAGGRVIIRWQAPGGGRLRLLVQDTGAGMAPEQLGRLFTPFDRLGAERGSTQGTGLGLALSLRLMEAMDGTITAESLPGTGSTFALTLPVASPPATAGDRTPACPPAIIPALAEALVLYIEDNLSNFRLVERILAQRPAVQLLAAMQGSLGVDLARQHRPRLILLDANLPDMHGAEVLSRLRALPETRDIPVVIVSADAIPAHVERLRAAGAQDYITKPINVRRFLDAVDGLLAGPAPVRAG